MIPSRPNGVLNQGTPAYGYAPCGVSVTIICRSETERAIHSSSSSLVAWMRQPENGAADSAPVSAANA